MDVRTGKTRNRPQLAERVREVLQMLGGEAHRGLVIEQVAMRMGHDVRRIPEDLQSALISSFEADARGGAAYGFHLPFGEGSHRWGLRRDIVTH